MVFFILRVMFMQGKRSSFADLMDDDAMNFGQHSFFLLSILSCLAPFPRMPRGASFVDTQSIQKGHPGVSLSNNLTVILGITALPLEDKAGQKCL